MSDYIKREDAIFVALQQPLYSVVSQIKQLDGIDIVRCKECKYEPICNHSVQHTTHEPTSVTIGCKAVEFCSYGERSKQ